MANSLAQDTDLDLLSVAVGGSTVEITPTITSGVKIADYVVDDVPGSLYTPEYSAGTGININNNTISVTGDITPYSGSEYIDITNHKVSVATPRKLVVDSTLYKSVNTATNELHIGGNYTEGTGIEIDDNIISVTGDIIPYSGSSGISVSNHNISITGNVGSLFEAVYGQTSYSDITAAIADKKIVYCRITPTGASRMAFLAYISNNNVEFQYYRSVGTHTSAQQGDEVYVYTCSSNNTWTTTTRQAYTKIAVGSNLGSAYSNGTLTISANGSANYATSAGSADYATSAGNSNFATSAAEAQSAKSAKSAENIIVGGTNYYGWFDIPAYSAAAAKFYINTDTANKFSYNLNTKILRVNAISANYISASAFSGNLSGTAFAAESAYQCTSAESALLADSAQRAQSAYNIRVYGTDADLYYDIPLYLDVSSELHVDNNNKLLYNPSTNILSATNIIVDNISATTIYGPTVLTAGKNITITDNVIDCNDAKSNFVYGNNTVNVNTSSFTGNFIACQGNSAIAPYFYGNTIFGNSNKMSGGISYSFLAGQYNEIIGNTYNNTIFGANNIISGNDAYYNTIVGTNNSAQDQTSYSFIAGTYNLLSGTNYTNVGVNVLGYDNRVKTFGSYRGSLIAGNGNTVSSNTFGDTSIILGQQNNISGDQIYNMGYYNNISGRHVHSFGERNSASNIEYSMNIGFMLNNTSTSSIQIGFSTAYYIEITPSGIYKILNGVRTSL